MNQPKDARSRSPQTMHELLMSPQRLTPLIEAEVSGLTSSHGMCMKENAKHVNNEMAEFS
jgi:hypothetical protein